MKKTAIVLVLIAIVGTGIGVWMYIQNNNENKNSNKNNETNYQAERSSANTNQKNSNKDNTNINNNISTENKIIVPRTETEISSFSTKVYNKDEERQNNMSITCQALNTKEIQPGETFSFCDTVGRSTLDKGYKEADIYVDGEKKQGLGGGNCQVSTTLYNAVLKVPELEVVERHQHSGYVPYIEEGKDAAVAYDSYDFKFKNNTQNVIKIVMESTAENITAKILKIS